MDRISKVTAEQVVDAISHSQTLLFAQGRVASVQANVFELVSEMVRKAVLELESLGEAQLVELEKLAVKGSFKSYSIYEKDFGVLPLEEEAILNSLKSCGLLIEEPLGEAGTEGYDEYAYYLTDLGRIVYRLWQDTKRC